MVRGHSALRGRGIARVGPPRLPTSGIGCDECACDLREIWLASEFEGGGSSAKVERIRDYERKLAERAAHR